MKFKEKENGLFILNFRMYKYTFHDVFKMNNVYI